MNGSPFDSALLNRHFYFERSIVITPCRDSTPRLDTQLLPRARPSCGHRTIVRIDRRKSRSLWLGKAVVAAVLFHRKSGTIGAAVGLCRKKTESRGVNIIRGRKGHGGRRLNTPPRPYDLPTFFPPQSLGHLSRFPCKTRLSLHFPPFLGQNLRMDFSLVEFWWIVTSKYLHRYVFQCVFERWWLCRCHRWNFSYIEICESFLNIQFNFLSRTIINLEPLLIITRFKSSCEHLWVLLSLFTEKRRKLEHKRWSTEFSLKIFFSYDVNYPSSRSLRLHSIIHNFIIVSSQTHYISFLALTN